jgi:hypothetical protein
MSPSPSASSATIGPSKCPRSTERARWIGYRWEQYRRLWWGFALVAGLIVAREFLPVPRLFGRDGDEAG